MCVTTLTRIELQDMLAEAKGDYQHYRRIGNTQGMAQATSDINAINIELTCSNNITIEHIQLPLI